MALFGTNSSNDDGSIRARYDKLEKDFKKLQQESRYNEDSLRDALKNLTSVALGSNHELDFQLKRLEVQLKDMQSPKQLCTTTEVIHGLKKQSNAAFGSELRGIMKQLIDYSTQLPNSNKIQQDIAQLEKSMASANNLELPSLMQQLTASLKKTIEISIEKRKPLPWYKRILGVVDTGNLNLEPIAQTLNYLLAHMELPATLAEEQNKIIQLIKGNADTQDDTPSDNILPITSEMEQGNLIQALELTGQLVIKAHRYHERQMSQFISEVNSQISFMEDLLFKQEQNNLIQQEETKSFDTTIESNFQNLRDELQSSDNIEVLRNNVTGSLGVMMEKVKNYSKKQAKRAQESQEEIRRLNERVRETELMANQLAEDLSKTAKEALSDALTGLPNRAAFDKRIEEEFARWQRFKHPLTIMVCDIDHFKSVNDTYGHKAGDRVIQTLGKTLKDNLRKVDFVGRYGGEEFVILFEKNSVKQALDVAEKLRKKVAELGFHFNDKPVKITMSFGLTQFKESDSTESAFERADQALYHSKENGRNQVTAAD